MLRSRQLARRYTMRIVDRTCSSAGPSPLTASHSCSKGADLTIWRKKRLGLHLRRAANGCAGVPAVEGKWWTAQDCWQCAASGSFAFLQAKGYGVVAAVIFIVLSKARNCSEAAPKPFRRATAGNAEAPHLLHKLACKRQCTRHIQEKSSMCLCLTK